MDDIDWNSDGETFKAMRLRGRNRRRPFHRDFPHKYFIKVKLLCYIH